jgi:hypothetical protein
MSYPEKRTVVSVVSGALLMVAYCIYAYAKLGFTNLTDLKPWATTMLVFIGIGIVAMIIIQIVFHILLSMGIALKEKIRDESIDDKKIESTIASEMIEDEMDKLIELKAHKIGYSFVGFGFVAGLITLAFGLPAAIMLNVLFLASMLGSIVEGLIQLRYYRKGV